MEGRTLSHYRILERLRSGALGEVYEAEDTLLGRRVSLEILSKASPAWKERFEREARTVAALSHPGIQGLYSVEEAGDTSFVVSELVDGRLLADSIPPDGLAISRLFEIAIALSDAVATAHERGVVHGALTGAGVMLTDDGRVKVLDFGLGRLMKPEAARPNDVPYMSPERVSGARIDRRSDVFSLGVFLYEMATGQLPFGGDTPLAVIAAIMTSEPRPIGDLSSPLHSELWRIIRACLDKAPEARFQTARELKDALVELWDKSSLTELSAASADAVSSPISMRRSAAPAVVLSPPRERGRSEPSPLRWWLTATVVGLAFIALFEGSRNLMHRSLPSEVRTVAVLPFENLGEPNDTPIADGTVEEITSRLAQTEGIGVVSRSAAFERSPRWFSSARHGEPPPADFVLKGTIERTVGEDGPKLLVKPRLIRIADEAEVWSSTYDSASGDLFGVQSEIAKRVAREVEGELVPTQPRQRPRFTEHDGYYLTTVFYATDRERDPELGFTGKRGGEELRYGMVEVSIPSSHEPGAIESPRWFWQTTDPSKHVAVRSIEPFDEPETFAIHIRSLLAEAGRDDALVFVHGYRVSFEEAAQRTAQLAWDLKFTGAPIFYSWPTSGETEDYTVDEGTVEWTTPHFEEFLRFVLSDLGARNVHVIAHSMGNRALLRALSTFDPDSLPEGAARLRQIVLAAPDIDAAVFRQLAENFPGKADRITLYTSRNDWAIQASKKFHAYPRAGGELVIVDHVDTIDASRVESGFLNHSYFGDSIVSDIFALIKNDLPPWLRYGLAERRSDLGTYWEFLPAGRPWLTWKGWLLVLGLLTLLIVLGTVLWRRHRLRLC